MDAQYAARSPICINVQFVDRNAAWEIFCDVKTKDATSIIVGIAICIHFRWVPCDTSTLALGAKMFAQIVRFK